MSREKAAYRDNLELIMEMFPNKGVLTINDVVRYTGKNSRTVKKHFPFIDGLGISVATLARILSYDELGRK